jgi:hypothetical protein
MPEELHETTNAVLKEKIDGLTKLTDVEFGHLKTGLADIKGMMQSFATKTELEHVKKDFTDVVQRIERDFLEHNKADVISFKSITDGQDSLRGTIKFWGGGLAVIGVALPFILKYFL